jgi:hypothetical protein
MNVTPALWRQNTCSLWTWIQHYVGRTCVPYKRECNIMEAEHVFLMNVTPTLWRQNMCSLWTSMQHYGGRTRVPYEGESNIMEAEHVFLMNVTRTIWRQNTCSLWTWLQHYGGRTCVPYERDSNTMDTAGQLRQTLRSQSIGRGSVTNKRVCWAFCCRATTFSITALKRDMTCNQSIKLSQYAHKWASTNIRGGLILCILHKANVPTIPHLISDMGSSICVTASTFVI